MKLNNLKTIIDNLGSGRWEFPVNSFLLRETFKSKQAEFWGNYLEDYAKENFSKKQVLLSLKNNYDLLLNQKESNRDVIELAWTGPEAPSSTLRDTGVVAQELFRGASNEVLIVGFAFYQGKVLFKEIAKKLDVDKDFKVTFIVDIRREDSKSSDDAILVKFKTEFKNKQWPGTKLPEIYYDPRTLDQSSKKRSSMHAKCIIVDSSKMFLTSANFTEAAHKRNIEAGVVINSKEEAISMKSQFFNLIEMGYLKKL